MLSSAKKDPTHRTVVLLRSSEKQRLARLAREQNVSSSEIMRRGLLAYERSSESEDLETVVAEMNQALDKALEAVRSARTEVALNIATMRQLRAEHA